ncbi:FmdB family zinc ribbon protein [candidate division KSB1 bacterium]
MPTYEYKCESCRCKFEEFQGINESPLEVCPSCKSGKVKKLMSVGGGLLFRGSGFYVTDYKGHGKGNGNGNGNGKKSKLKEVSTENKTKSVDNKKE